MKKRLILILALAFVASFAFAAYAEVQNVKVSGDILVSGISRDNFNLLKNTALSQEDSESLFLSQTRLRVDADLTDNVMVTIRLINERNWGVQDTVTNNNDDIDLDLAYVNLKEFLYSPLSLKIGRQEVRLGNGFVIGNSRNYVAGVNIGAAASSIAGVPTDLTMKKAFDAIRVTLNYDPLVIDAIYSKIDENLNTQGVNRGPNDDINLYGINAKYDLDKKTSIEAYGLARIDSDDGTTAGIDKPVKAYTVGALVSMNPIERLKASGELAFQFANSRQVAGGQSDTQTNAVAFQTMLSYDLNMKYSPIVELDYTYLGNRWNAMYYDQPGVMNNIVYTILPYTNLQALNLKGSMKPVEDITLLANWGWYRTGHKNRAFAAANANSDGTNYGAYTVTDQRSLCTALDLTATYDYTEDVQFGLTNGWLFPGAAFAGDQENAMQVIGTMKVTF
ncbi:MAG: hypothetical protein FJZ08_03685 [Candidatus Omnitrophica bacterium]|nr:hypothetical protein [Candidatus Omnitrophota bacterium]